MSILEELTISKQLPLKATSQNKSFSVQKHNYVLVQNSRHETIDRTAFHS